MKTIEELLDSAQCQGNTDLMESRRHCLQLINGTLDHSTRTRLTAKCVEQEIVLQDSIRRHLYHEPSLFARLFRSREGASDAR